MNDQLKLTARGHAVCELMADLGLTLEAACARVDFELETLRQRVDSILAESAWQDVPAAVRAALESVSPGVQHAYLDESGPSGESTALPSAAWHDGVFLH